MDFELLAESVKHALSSKEELGIDEALRKVEAALAEASRDSDLFLTRLWPFWPVSQGANCLKNHGGGK